MSTAVEGDDVGDVRPLRCEHSERRDEGVVALAMHNIPATTSDGAVDSGREVKVTPGWPSTHSLDHKPGSCVQLDRRVPPREVGGQYRDVVPRGCQAVG